MLSNPPKLIFKYLASFLYLILSLLLFSSVGSYAAIITVNGSCTLPDAINSANNDILSGSCSAGNGTDTIVFDFTTDSTISISGSLSISTNMSILNNTGHNITLSGGTDSVFLVTSGTLTLENLTIADGNAPGGFSSNGGGINNNGGTININNCTFSNNQANGNGGAIYNNSGTITITNSTFFSNTAANGGGIFNNSGTVTLGNSTITGNTATTNPDVQGTFGTNGSNIIGDNTGASGSFPAGTPNGNGDYVGTGGSLVVSHTLTLNTAGTGNGNVSSSPTSTSCGTNCQRYANDTTVSLTATPTSGSTFDGWNCANSFSISMDMTCTATFTEEELVPEEETTSSKRRSMEPLPRELHVFVELYGSGRGSVKSEPLGINCAMAHCTRIDHRQDITGVECEPNFCTHPFKTANDVILKPMPEAGSIFTGWGGHPDCADGELWMIGNKLCIAFFQKAHRLTVGQAGDGMGNIRSYPFGIHCGNGNSTCFKDFRQNATITLTASPATGSSFVGWRGDCEGSTLRTQVKMNAAKDCTAYFVASP